MSVVRTCPPRLGDGALEVHGGSCSIPTYDRRLLTPSIVHFGVGRFHRSHQAAYLDRLAEGGCSLAWGVLGVGLRNRVVSDTLAAQDGLYTLVERDRTGESARVIGSITRCLYGPDDPRAVLSALTDPRTRLVTLTITDGGYGVDPITRRLSPVDAAVARDLEQPDAPSTVFGYIVAALAPRRRAGAPPPPTAGARAPAPPGACRGTPPPPTATPPEPPCSPPRAFAPSRSRAGSRR